MTNKPKNWEKSVDELLHDILSAHDKNDYGERAIEIDGLKQFIQLFLQHRTQEILEGIEKLVNESVEETTKEHKESSIWIDMVGEIMFEKLIKLKHKYDQTN